MTGPALSRDRPLAVAILAMDGQGAGVLSDWIVALAERRAGPGRPDAAAWVRGLRSAALADEAGTALDGALRTVASFTVPAHAP